MSRCDNCGAIIGATPLHPQRGLAVPRRRASDNERFFAAWSSIVAVSGVSMMRQALVQCWRRAETRYSKALLAPRASVR